mgnify:CR=1 FL=1
MKISEPQFEIEINGKWLPINGAHAIKAGDVFRTKDETGNVHQLAHITLKGIDYFDVISWRATEDAALHTDGTYHVDALPVTDNIALAKINLALTIPTTIPKILGIIGVALCDLATFGFIAPILISAGSTLLVAGGVILVAGVLTINVVAIKTIFFKE